MPNWCDNYLSISGSPEKLKEMLDASIGLPAQYPLAQWEKELGRKEEILTTPYFCFNALVPVPPEVLGRGYDAHESIPQSVRLNAIQGVESGDLDGYHWSIVHWGTKWDIYSCGLDLETIGWKPGCTEVHFGFETAWAPPRAWMKKVAQKYPELNFHLHFEEPGCYFAGDFEASNGECSVRYYEDEELKKVFAWMEEE